MNPLVQESLARLEEQRDLPLQEYRDAITKELCWLTGSEISYFAGIDGSGDILTMIGWSRSAMNNCMLIDKPIVYQLSETGLWGDAVREDQVVITNDYVNSTKPTKKGYPEGHVEVFRHMNLPIYDGDRITLVVGVGNKEDEYTLEDAELVEELMSAIWRDFQKALWTTSAW